MKPTAKYNEQIVQAATLLIPSASFRIPFAFDYSSLSFAKIIGSMQDYKILQIKVPYNTNNSTSIEYFSRIVICKDNWLANNAIRLSSALKNFEPKNLKLPQINLQVLAHNPMFNLALVQHNDSCVNASKCFLQIASKDKLKNAIPHQNICTEVNEVIFGMIEQSKLFNDYELMNLLVTEHRRLKQHSLRIQEVLEEGTLSEEIIKQKQLINNLKKVDTFEFSTKYSETMHSLISKPTFIHSVLAYNQNAEQKIDINNIKLEDYQKLVIINEEENLQKLEKKLSSQQEKIETYKQALLETEIIIEEILVMLQQLQEQYGLISYKGQAKMELINEKETPELLKNKFVN